MPRPIPTGVKVLATCLLTMVVLVALYAASLGPAEYLFDRYGRDGGPLKPLYPAAVAFYSPIAWLGEFGRCGHHQGFGDGF